MRGFCKGCSETLTVFNIGCTNESGKRKEMFVFSRPHLTFGCGMLVRRRVVDDRFVVFSKSRALAKFPTVHHVLLRSATLCPLRLVCCESIQVRISPMMAGSRAKNGRAPDRENKPWGILSMGNQVHLPFCSSSLRC